jgi:hypothetical protein
MTSDLHAGIFDRLDSNTLRKVMNIGVLCFSMFLASGLVFCKVEAWAQRQEADVRLAVIAMDADIMVEQTHREAEREINNKGL